MRFSMSFNAAAASSFALLGALAPSVLADIAPLSGSVRLSTGQTGATFGALFEYDTISATSGELTISISNQTPLEVGGFLTGIVFRFDSDDPSASATLTSTTDPDFLDTGADTAPPFGMFDGGAALNGNWAGGGNPSFGIPAGQSGVLTFAISASDASELSVHDFIHGTEFPSVVVRFRGLKQGDSDKVPGRGLECDWNDDGLITSMDFFDFLEDFFAQDSDYNEDGVTNIKDFFDFLRCFFTEGGN